MTGPGVAGPPTVVTLTDGSAGAATGVEGAGVLSELEEISVLPGDEGAVVMVVVSSTVPGVPG
jgi:hypothetical protein